MTNKILRTGYTTGTCAAAATKAALLMLKEKIVSSQVELTLPNKESITIEINKVWSEQNQVVAEVIKDAGDDPDVTHGIKIQVAVEYNRNNQAVNNNPIIISGGTGIGLVTKPGLSVAVGEYAINPIPRKMILEVAKEMLSVEEAVFITISAVNGEEIAKKTLNAKLGIIGGISILGTTGIVRPMSDRAYVDSLIPQINVATASGHKLLALTPGGMGERLAIELGIEKTAIVQMSNYVSQLVLASARQESVEGIMLFGHIGKLIKIAAGVFNTHSKIADARRETLAAYVGMYGGTESVIKRIMELNTIDESKQLLFELGLEHVYDKIAGVVSQKVMELIAREMPDRSDIKVGTVMYTLDGKIVAQDRQGEQMLVSMASAQYKGVCEKE